MIRKQFIHVLKELQEHLPYTVFSVASGIAILGILTVLIPTESFPQLSEKLFHVFHPIHMLFSAVATTSMFWRYNKNLFKAILVGFVGAVGICGTSDIIIPFIAGNLLTVKMQLHICIIAHPRLILPFVSFGIFIGLLVPTIIQSTIFSHSAHILTSSMASILYLVSFGLTEWIPVAGMVFIYIVLAVILPCCTSDIVFPLLFVKR
ncbi:MAG: hypothetical protein QME68_01290 [Elusimicrobiota bacterium]|nr:hypothetical protein [Elusimicrobiota bacterium]